MGERLGTHKPPHRCRCNRHSRCGSRGDNCMRLVNLRLALDAQGLEDRDQFFPELPKRLRRLPYVHRPEAVLTLPCYMTEQSLHWRRFLSTRFQNDPIAEQGHKKGARCPFWEGAPGTALELSSVKNWCRGAELNCRHRDFQSRSRDGRDIIVQPYSQAEIVELLRGEAHSALTHVARPGARVHPRGRRPSRPCC